MSTTITIKQNGNGIEVSEAKKIFEKARELEKDLDYEDKSLTCKLNNRFSGEYWTPTFKKSFMSCPAKCFIEALLPRKDSLYANIGSCTHKIFENFVKNDFKNLSIDEIVRITEEEINNFETSDNANDIKQYVNSFCKMKDYKNEKLFDWNGVDSYPEAFYKDNIIIYDCDLGPLYCLIDRIDIRESGIYIVDYKTGNPQWFNKDTFIDNYLDQFIAYKWMIEKKYGLPISGAYAYMPAFNKHIEMPVNSMESQSRLVEGVLKYYDSIKEQNKEGIYKETPGIHCRYCKFKDKCNSNNKTKNSDSFSFEID